MTNALLLRWVIVYERRLSAPCTPLARETPPPLKKVPRRHEKCLEVWIEFERGAKFPMSGMRRKRVPGDRVPLRKNPLHHFTWVN